MNTKKSRSLLCLILAALMLFLSACSQDEGESSPKEKNEEVLVSMKIFWKKPMCELEYSVGGTPHCIIYCTMATVLSVTDLPPALGPDISRMRPS